MRQDEQQRWVSDDGHWAWDGTTWTPMSVAPTESPTPDVPPDAVAAPPEATASTPGTQPDATHPLSPDGSQVWDGTSWVPYAPLPTESTPADPAPVAPVESTPVEPTPAPAVTASESVLPSPPDEHPISSDGHWRWDGQAWQAIESSTPEQSGTRQLSADGRWVWDGQAWQPTDKEAAKSPAPSNLDPGVTALIASGMPVSADGQWVWNGQAWQPAIK
jgi:hypothetical protein